MNKSKKSTYILKIRNRRIILVLEKIYDKIVPSFIKNNRTFNKWLYKYLIGSWFDVDFKQKYEKFKTKDWIYLYDSLYVHRIRDEDITENQKKFVLKYLEGNSIVDVGCGLGFLCKQIVMKNDKYKVVGCDLSPVAIKDDNERFRRISRLKFKVENITQLSFRDKQFDTSISCHVIEHVLNYKKAIRELVRITMKRLIIIVPEEYYKKYSPDYHINYFNRDNRIESYFPKDFTVVDTQLVDGDRCLVLDKNI